MNQYKLLRNQYMPKKLRVILVLESPPANGKYFYNPNGKISEILFRSLMTVLLDIKPQTKDEGLRKFSEAGYLLVDPIYEPVDNISDKKADKLIMENYFFFIKDLKTIIGNTKNVKIILIKKNICTLLEKPLLTDGFNVVNNYEMIPFPLHYHMNSFSEKVRRLLK